MMMMAFGMNGVYFFKRDNRYCIMCAYGRMGVKKTYVKHVYFPMKWRQPFSNATRTPPGIDIAAQKRSTSVRGDERTNDTLIERKTIITVAINFNNSIIVRAHPRRRRLPGFSNTIASCSRA